MKQSSPIKQILILGITLGTVGIAGCATLSKKNVEEEYGSAGREEFLNRPNIKRLMIGNANGRNSEENEPESKNSRNKTRRGMHRKGISEEKRGDAKFEEWKSSSRIPLSPHVPLLEEPKVKTIWVEDQIRGNRFIESHFEHVLEENAKWKK